MMEDLARIRRFEGVNGLPLSQAHAAIDTAQLETVEAASAGAAESLSFEAYSALPVRLGEQPAIHRGREAVSYTHLQLPTNREV